MRRLPILVAAVLAIAATDACERTEYVTLPAKPDTVIVQRPGHVDTLIVPKIDTLFVPKPETSFVQLPGKVDTVITQHTDTVTVKRIDTLLVVVHDTVVQHDTVVHVDTVQLSKVSAFICLTLPKADTLFALSGDVTPYCNATHLAPQFPGKVMVDAPGATIVLTLPAPSSAASAFRGTTLLPGYLKAHGGAYR